MDRNGSLLGGMGWGGVGLERFAVTITVLYYWTRLFVKTNLMNTES